MNHPIRVAVTGAAGQIGYAMLFRLASGEIFGPDQPVILHLVEVPPVLSALDGVEMELEDCAFPTLAGVVKADSDHLEDGFAERKIKVSITCKQLYHDREEVTCHLRRLSK